MMSGCHTLLLNGVLDGVMYAEEKEQEEEVEKG